MFWKSGFTNFRRKKYAKVTNSAILGAFLCISIENPQFLFFSFNSACHYTNEDVRNMVSDANTGMTVAYCFKGLQIEATVHSMQN